MLKKTNISGKPSDDHEIVIDLRQRDLLSKFNDLMSGTRYNFELENMYAKANLDQTKDEFMESCGLMNKLEKNAPAAPVLAMAQYLLYRRSTLQPDKGDGRKELAARKILKKTQAHTAGLKGKVIDEEEDVFDRLELSARVYHAKKKSTLAKQVEMKREHLGIKYEPKSKKPIMKAPPSKSQSPARSPLKHHIKVDAEVPSPPLQ